MSATCVALGERKSDGEEKKAMCRQTLLPKDKMLVHTGNEKRVFFFLRKVRGEVFFDKMRAMGEIKREVRSLHKKRESSALPRAFQCELVAELQALQTNGENAILAVTRRTHLLPAQCRCPRFFGVATNYLNCGNV